MRNISVEFLCGPSLEKQEVELVERKGIGHPDSICDGIAESVSRGLCREYLDRFGHILHHNTDQVELVGGESSPVFGSTEIIKPIFILLSGRATTEFNGEHIPIDEVALKSARAYLKDTIKHIDLENGVVLDDRIGMGSMDLRDVFGRDGIPKSNDTSFGVSHAPFSLTEKLAYNVEKFINGPMKKKIPASGQDVKVMGVRKNDEIILTIGNGMVARYIKDIDEYVNIVQQVQSAVMDEVVKMTDKKVSVDVNTGDNIEKQSVFLTVTGTSAEMGDDGSVGRGNRANGLITPYRPMSMEATAGKNPVNHVGKIYNLLSKEIARDIAREGAEQAYVRLMSQIGKPIDQPLCADVQIVGDAKMEKKAKEIADYWLENVTEITNMCVEGKAETF
ncbi:MAG TPA: methionine adenosyltransferase [Candidatus Altiarchaeales archaeon]|nr:methionine adenosyltransferase [Candidatus Altiarchaeales archaeon]